MRLGMGELVLILILSIVIFSHNLPKLGESMGKCLNGIRKHANKDKEDEDNEQ